MKVKHEFRTRREAGEYLEARGWKRSGDSLGDWLFIHPENREMGGRIIVKLNNKKWRIAVI